MFVLPVAFELAVERVLEVVSNDAELVALGSGDLEGIDGRLTFDGESVWMDPSVGNWSLPCRSYYWIRGNHIQWPTFRQSSSGRSSRTTATRTP